MSLYDGLLDDSDALSTPLSSSAAPSDSNRGLTIEQKSIDMLRSQLRARKASQRVAAAAAASSSSSLPSASSAPVVDFNRKRLGHSDYVVAPSKSTHVQEPQMSRASEAVTDFFQPVVSSNEYDPLHPNDYETIKERKRLERKRKRALKHSGPLTGADFLQRKDLMSNQAIIITTTEPTAPQQQRPAQNPCGAAVANKIMAKMGYRKGQGLGRQNQGISRSLVVEKTSRVGGKIIQDDRQETSRSKPLNPPDPFRNPSKVVLLRNMVGRGEVDGELETETKEECLKYGNVRKVVIFEIPDVPDDEAVRIFVEFEHVDSSVKAVVDLNGRFFGGRSVKADFYNLDKFRQYVLGENVR